MAAERGGLSQEERVSPTPSKIGFVCGCDHFVEECLLSKNSSMARYFDQGYIRQMLEQDRNGSQQYRRHIYLLVSLELWHRAFMLK